MKKLMFIALLFQASFAFSQVAGIDATYIKDPKTRGYLQGVRLDSIEAGYASVDRRGESLSFNYGQGGKVKSMLVTDKNGLPLKYSNRENIFWLNFLYFNGWEYLPDSTSSLVKKRR